MKVVVFAGMSFVKGQRLRVAEEKGVFYGKFEKFSMSNTRLDLTEVTDDTGRPSGRFRYFQQQHVCSVQDAGSVKVELCNVEPQQSILRPHPICCLSEEQLEHIMKTIKEPVLVNQPGSVYFNALADIYKHLTVGVAAEKSQSGRVYKMQKLSISTSNKVYIFDLALLNSSKTMNDLKKLFESSEYLKLVFDCRMLLDNLQSNFNVNLEPAFDLMLAAAQFHPKDEVSSLASCIKTVLGVDLPKNSASQQETLAAFLPALYHKIVNSNFTQDFHRRFEQSISPRRSLNDFYSTFKPGDSDVDDFNQTSISGGKEIDFSIYDITGSV